MKNWIPLVIALLSPSAFAEKYECTISVWTADGSEEGQLDPIVLEASMNQAVLGRTRLTDSLVSLAISELPRGEMTVQATISPKGQSADEMITLGTDVKRGVQRIGLYAVVKNASKASNLKCRKKR